MKKLVGLLILASALAQQTSDYETLVMKAENELAMEFNSWCEIKRAQVTYKKRSKIEKDEWSRVEQKWKTLDNAVNSLE